jgi:DNA replication and repair protein RecF
MLKSLRLDKFRGIEDAALPFSSNSIVVIGENGQGKSSLLEAIFLLSNLRSFRTSNLKELRRIGSDYFAASCEILRASSWTSRLEMNFDSLGKRLKIDGVPVAKASDFIRKFKTVAFLPDDPMLISGASQQRRRFMDMSISMLSQEYFVSIQKYMSALKSRNFMLKSGRFEKDVMDSFDAVLASSGAKVNAERRFVLSKISDLMNFNIKEIRPELSNMNLKLKCSKEYDSETVFLDRLKRDFEKDKQRGFTNFGPHLDDFDIVIDSKNLRQYGSRGQCRMASLCLKLAEFELVLSSGPSSDSVVIVDDCTGDLDERAKSSFYERIKRAGQVFYSFTSAPDEMALKDAQQFHIHSGKTTIG